MGSRKKPRPPRLKDSCDKCALAKIRCDKMKPKCSRCVKRGHQCSYSLAHWTGKPGFHGRPPPGLVRTATYESLKYNQSPARNLTLEGTRPTFIDSRKEETPALDILESRVSIENHHEVADIEVGHESTDHDDCAARITDAIQQVETSKARLSLGLADINSALQTLNAITDIASAIFQCQCCANLDIGFLIAAVSVSLIDLYSSILAGASNGVLVSPVSVHDASCLILSPEDEQIFYDLLKAESGSLSSFASVNPEISIRIREVTLKLHRLVALFTEHYRDQNIEDGSLDIQNSINDLLKAKSSSVFHEGPIRENNL